jgi:segregation and condensation protein B
MDDENDDNLFDDATSEEPEEELTLEGLSQAYSQLLGEEDPSDAADEAEGEESDEEQADGAAPVSEEAAPEEVELSPRSILEGMLFVGSDDNEPFSGRQIAARLRGVSPDEVDELVLELNSEYYANGCPYEILSQGSGYRLALREEFASLRDKFHGKIRQARLSQSSIDVLALVAYKQPITREDVDKLRGYSSNAVLNQLVRRQLLSFERDEKRRRVRYYSTTDRFLKLFNLTSLDDLPQSQEAPME